MRHRRDSGKRSEAIEIVEYLGETLAPTLGKDEATGRCVLLTVVRMRKLR